jgi:hypothetical protein
MCWNFKLRSTEARTTLIILHSTSLAENQLIDVGRDYVSELRPQTGLLLISQVIHEHGEPWWIYIDRGILLMHPLELSGNPTSRVIKQQSRRNLGEGNCEFCLRKVSLSYSAGIFNIP